MRVFAILFGVAGACRDHAAERAPPPAPPPREAFGDVIAGLPIVRLGDGYVTAVTFADGDVALRALVDGRHFDLERFTPRDCPVLDLGETYFVHGYTCRGDPEAWIPLEVRLECDELAWNGSQIVISRRTVADREHMLPATCR